MYRWVAHALLKDMALDLYYVLVIRSLSMVYTVVMQSSTRLALYFCVCTLIVPFHNWLVSTLTSAIAVVVPNITYVIICKLLVFLNCNS